MNMIGKSIAGYHITQKIGAGGMGEVYLANDNVLKRKVAMKFLRSTFVSDQDARARFVREAQSAAALNHPNIVTVYGFGEFDEGYYMAMEYVPGESIDKLIKSNKLTLEQKIDIMLQICSGLAEAHANGIIHRDIKPRNLIVDPRGRVRILDFGIAKLNKAPEITLKGATLGTLHYLAPEQIGDGLVDARCDIFSAGIVFYELLSGQRPFTGSNPPAILNSILNNDPLDLLSIKPDTPQQIAQLVHRGLQKDPLLRYQSVDEMLADLKELITPADIEISGLQLDNPDLSETPDDYTRKWVTILGIELISDNGAKEQHLDDTFRLHRRPAQNIKEIGKEFQARQLIQQENTQYFRFDTATDGVNFAVRLQNTFNEESAEPKAVDGPAKVWARIVLHMGEEVASANTMIDGIEEVKALLKQCPPGGILLTENYRALLPLNQIPEIESMGVRRINHLGLDIEIHQLLTGSERWDMFAERTVELPPAIGAKPLQKAPGKWPVITGILAVACVLAVLFFDWSDIANRKAPETTTENPLPETLAAKVQLTTAQTSLVQDLRRITSTDSLQEFLAEGRRQGRWIFGQKQQFFEHDNKIVVIVDREEILQTFLFTNNNYVDPLTGESLENLSDHFSGKIDIWLELFDE